jgi:hypothetical protein
MPSKQSNNDVIAIEELVNEIKQNLRLKAVAPAPATGVENQHQHSFFQPSIYNHEKYLQQPKLLTNSHSQQQLIIKKQRSRPSPYHIPCRSWSDNATAQKQKNPHRSCNNDENTIEDPYEVLQSLIRNNSLVKEAVKRLQKNASSYSRKQNYFYDSDEDNRSPSIVMMCQLES